jgi:hypothetical protein
MNEQIPPSPLFHKPLSIVAAKNLLYAVLFLNLITWAIGWWSAGVYSAAPIQSIVILIVTVVATFVLIKCVGLAMKWARVVLLILFLLGLAGYLWSFSVLWKTSIVIAVLSLLQLILEAVALGYLFSRDSTLWFDRVREKERDEPHPAAHVHEPKH